MLPEASLESPKKPDCVPVAMHEACVKAQNKARKNMDERASTLARNLKPTAKAKLSNRFWLKSTRRWERRIYSIRGGNFRSIKDGAQHPNGSDCLGSKKLT